MIWVHTSSIAAQMVKFQSIWDWAARVLVIERVGHHQQSSILPHAGVTVCLHEREVPASRDWIFNDIGPLVPPWEWNLPKDSPHILRVRHSLQMIWIYACAIAAQVIKLITLGDRAIALLPIPDVTHVELAVPSDAGITIVPMNGLIPASSFSIYGVPLSDTMANQVHERLARDVSPATLARNGSRPAASAHTKSAGIAQPLHPDLVVPAQESVIAALHVIVAAIIRYCRWLPASAHAKAARVRAAWIVGRKYFAALRHAAVVAFDVAGLSLKWLAASASAVSYSWGVHLVSSTDQLESGKTLTATFRSLHFTLPNVGRAY